MAPLPLGGCRSAALSEWTCVKKDLFNPRRKVYLKSELLALRKISAGIKHNIPIELKKRYRGTRAGAKLKARAITKKERRRRYKPTIPSVVMGNVNALSNKVDELFALVRSQRIYRESSLIMFTETWLTASIPDFNVELPGFSIVRADRDTAACGKSKGGGLILYINNRWCNPGHFTVKSTICCRDCELLAVSIRPYYLPREFTHVLAVCVYIPPRAHVETAIEAVVTVVADLQSRHPEAVVVISGDFNHVTLDSSLSAMYQYVDCPTRGDNTIDLLYANIKDAYEATPLPPLGKSDHNLISLQPRYTPLVKREPPTIRTVRRWTPEAEEELRDCFDSTDWSVLMDHFGEDIEGAAQCLTDYINFCTDIVVPTKTVCCYANNKPWITRGTKEVLNRKKRAYKEKDQMNKKMVQTELRSCLRSSRESYKEKLEGKLRENNIREVWDGMKTITGCRKVAALVGESEERANDLNTYFNRFDITSAIPLSLTSCSSTSSFSILDYPHPPPDEPAQSASALSHFSPITEHQVRRELKKLNIRKAAGPDRVCPRLLRACADELCSPLQHLFNLSLRLGIVPSLWKTSCIIPLPKVKHPRDNKDYRPVALTSHIMKILERLVLQLLKPQVQHIQDPLQFAYRERVGVEDAVLYLLHRTLSYLDKGGCAVRMLFFDFSSAFNTIQPLVLQDKLTRMEVEPYMVSWITDYLTNRLQFVRMGGSMSSTLSCSVGAPQGTVLSPELFTLYTSDFYHNTEACHMQKFSDDTVIVACIREGKEGEYRQLVQDFVSWSKQNQLQLNVQKTKEMILDFRKRAPPIQPIWIEGDKVETVTSYKYLGVVLDNKLDWSENTTFLHKKSQTRMYFLRRLASFNICTKLLNMFYQTVIASALMYAVVCWCSTSKKNINRLNKTIKKAGSVVGLKLAPVEEVAEQRTLSRFRAIMDNVSHPLHEAFTQRRSMFSSRLLSQPCSTDRLRKSFVPRAIRLHNSLM